MRDPRRRLEQLEYENLRRMAAKAGQPFGYSADQVLDEARRVLALPDDQQRQALRRLYDELSAEEAAELDEIRHRHAAILRRAR
jgi:DNA-directed RNA polymerase specialized sigma24 family protein